MSSSTLPRVLTGPELPVHPFTGLRAVGVLPSGRVVWPILGGAEDDGDNGDDGDDGDDDGDDGAGRVQRPQVSTVFTPITSQEELDRILGKRVAQVERRYRDYDAYREKATQYDALAAASQTDTERAIAEAEETAWNAAMAKAVPRVVRAEFKAQAHTAGLTKEQLDTLLEDLDLTKYANDEGDPDEDKIARKVTALAPARKQDPPPDFGQGKRGGNGKATDMNSIIRRAAGRG